MVKNDDKDPSYHQAAIEYNREFAQFATDYASRATHPRIAAWARSVGRQHNLHLERHQTSLTLMQERMEKENAQVDEGAVLVSEVPIDNPVPEQESTPAEAQNETATVAEEQENNA